MTTFLMDAVGSTHSFSLFRCLPLPSSSIHELNDCFTNGWQSTLALTFHDCLSHTHTQQKQWNWHGDIYIFQKLAKIEFEWSFCYSKVLICSLSYPVERVLCVRLLFAAPQFVDEHIFAKCFRADFPQTNPPSNNSVSCLHNAENFINGIRF